MAQKNSNPLGNNGGRFYDFLNRPVMIDCSFVVDATNGNGFGVRSLKGAGVNRVFMNTSAAFTGTSHTSNLIDGIASGTSSLLPGMPVQGSGIPAGTTILSIVSSGSITLSKATTSSTTGSITYQAIGNPNPAAGYAWIQLANNYNRYAGGFSGAVSPLSGSNVAINGTALTVGNPYVIVSVGHATLGAVTLAPVADSSGSLASTWFSLFDAYGNTFIIWFSVSGTGSAPLLGPAAAPGTVGLHYVQQSIVTNDTAATIGADLVVTIAALPSGIASVFSFTAAGTTTVTVTSTQTNPYGPLPGAPSDGVIPTGFTFAATKYKTNLQNWQNVGLPPGVTPNVGASFIATTTGDSVGGGSTGLVQAPSVSGLGSVEVVGDPNQSIGPIPMGGSPNVGGWILVQFLSPTSSSVTTPVATAPAINSVVGMSFIMEQAPILIGGE